MELIDALNWRYATKGMNVQKVSQEKLSKTLEATCLSASTGLQPYNIFLIKNKTLRRPLQQAANNQPQIVEGSHVLVFAAFKDISEKDVKD